MMLEKDKAMSEAIDKQLAQQAAQAKQFADQQQLLLTQHAEQARELAKQQVNKDTLLAQQHAEHATLQQEQLVRVAQDFVSKNMQQIDKLITETAHTTHKLAAQYLNNQIGVMDKQVSQTNQMLQQTQTLTDKLLSQLHEKDKQAADREQQQTEKEKQAYAQAFQSGMELANLRHQVQSQEEQLTTLRSQHQLLPRSGSLDRLSEYCDQSRDYQLTSPQTVMDTSQDQVASFAPTEPVQPDTLFNAPCNQITASPSFQLPAVASPQVAVTSAASVPSCPISVILHPADAQQVTAQPAVSYTHSTVAQFQPVLSTTEPSVDVHALLAQVPRVPDDQTGESSVVPSGVSHTSTVPPAASTLVTSSILTPSVAPDFTVTPVVAPTITPPVMAQSTLTPLVSQPVTVPSVAVQSTVPPLTTVQPDIVPSAGTPPVTVLPTVMHSTTVQSIVPSTVVGNEQPVSHTSTVSTQPTSVTPTVTTNLLPLLHRLLPLLLRLSLLSNKCL